MTQLRVRSTIAISIAAFSSVALVGCASDENAEGTEEFVSNNVAASVQLISNDTAAESEMDISRWTLPLDPYIVTRTQALRESYYHALLSQRCLGAKGFENTVPEPGLKDAEEGFVQGEAFTEAQAARYGYQHLRPERPEDQAWAEYIYRPLSEPEGAALDSCVRDIVADPDIPQYDGELLNRATQMLYAAMGPRPQGPQVDQATVVKWRACMAEAGITDIASDPFSMPTESMRERYGTTASPIDNAAPVTAIEVADATADARCRTSSGFTAARYQSLWELQSDVLKQNRDELDGIAERIQKIDAEIMTRTEELRNR